MVNLMDSEIINVDGKDEKRNIVLVSNVCFLWDIWKRYLFETVIWTKNVQMLTTHTNVKWDKEPQLDTLHLCAL